MKKQKKTNKKHVLKAMLKKYTESTELLKELEEENKKLIEAVSSQNFKAFWSISESMVDKIKQHHQIYNDFQELALHQKTNEETNSNKV